MAETDDAVVVTRRLTKVFRDFWLREKVTAVSDLDLDIQPREVFGLLGPNGSGKTTTLKLILGLLFPTRGTISVFGKLPTDVAIKSRIGFLPEDSYLYPFLDARETLDFYGRLFHQPRRQRMRRIDMLLDMVGLASVAYRRVGEYSKGMQRRIGLAQALINDPDLLILDEPTGGMDPIGTRQFKDLIETLALRGKTVILSSHLLADVEDVCDRVCILYGGKRRAQGAVSELLSHSDQTQLVTQRLDEATLDALRRQLIAAGKDLLAITHPHDKLETLFLRIVQEAQDQRVATGGALAGGQVAEFLRGEPAAGKGVIEELVAAAAGPSEPTPPAAPTEAAPPTKQTQAVLESLTSASGEEAEQAKPAEGQAAPKPTEPPPHTRAVLDELLGKPPPNEQER